MLQLNHVKKMVGEMAGKGIDDVRVVMSPYRICPLGAHIDHQVYNMPLNLMISKFSGLAYEVLPIFYLQFCC